MLVYLSIIIGAYAFTRLFSAGIRNYPNDDKLTGTVIRVLSILAAIIVFGCTALIVIQGMDASLKSILE